MTRMTREACATCIYLANDNKWCAEHGGKISTPDNSCCDKWKGEKARAAPASFLMREMEFEEY